MRIVHVCRVAPPGVGGMERQLEGLVAHLVGGGHEARVVTFDGPAGIRRVGPRRYPFGRGLRAAVADADVVHVHGVDGLADQLAWWRRRPMPVGLSTHGGYFHGGYGPLKRFFLRSWTARTLGRLDAVWFTSDADRDRFAPAGVRGTVVGNGVDVARLRPAERRPERGRWLVFGRVDRHKGHVRLLRALASPRLRDVHLVVVGRFETAEIESDVRIASGGASGLVNLLGEQPDDRLRAELARAELCLFPSEAEGFGIGVVEAMGAGVPVVVSDLPAHRERVRDGQDGVVVDFSDPERAAEPLASLLGADHRDRAVRAERTAAGYGWSVVGPQWERTYEDLIRRWRGDG